ncbi:MAG: hypothetical protein MUF45_00010 [Spirosomaceae bacterium]|jgi:hypothetical protein|nr:hypothetical protein [Spirosomataceae bacterium]
MKKFSDLYWFKVKISYDETNTAMIKDLIQIDTQFYIWRDILDASTCQVVQFVNTIEQSLSVGKTAQIIIVVIPSDLSASFRIGENLTWGVPQIRLGSSIIEDIVHYPELEYVNLYRPVNQQELDLIIKSNYKMFPPRLPQQPFFYQVLNEEYATKITQDWNVPAYGVGYVTKFKVKKVHLLKYEIHNVGGKNIDEYWIPSEELDEFNNNIVGEIEIIGQYQ